MKVWLVFIEPVTYVCMYVKIILNEAHIIPICMYINVCETNCIHHGMVIVNLKLKAMLDSGS